MRFTKAHRLHGRGTFKTILDSGARTRGGPINLAVARNDANSPRLGISIGRPVGNAARRNRIKRLLREAYRAERIHWPAIDVVILVRPHAPLKLTAYRTMLVDGVAQCLKRLPPSPDATSPNAG